MSFFIHSNGGCDGPFSGKQVIEQVKAGQIDHHSLLGRSPSGPFRPMAALFANLDEDRFFVDDGDRVSGPFSPRKMEDMAKSGQLRSDTRVSDARGNFLSLSQLGLAAAIGGGGGTVCKALLDYFGIGNTPSPQFVVENASLLSADFSDLAEALTGFWGAAGEILGDLFA